LDSLLIRPIQRIPRYNLLLNELLKATPQNHPDYPMLEDAKIMMKEISKHVNLSLHKKVSMEKMLEIKKKITKYDKVFL
jgi:hypothetical protein